MNDHSFSVMDMAASAAEDAGVDVKDLFKREDQRQNLLHMNLLRRKKNGYPMQIC